MVAKIAIMKNIIFEKKSLGPFFHCSVCFLLADAGDVGSPDRSDIRSH